MGIAVGLYKNIGIFLARLNAHKPASQLIQSCSSPTHDIQCERGTVATNRLSVRDQEMISGLVP